MAEAPSPGPPRTSHSSRPGSMPPPSIGAALPEACALGAICALVGSIPSALRAAREGGSLLGGWLASAMVVLPVLVAFIALSRTAGRGFRMLTGNRAGRSTAAGLALWVGLTSPLLVVLGTVLKAGTNHRGIGGATFGVLALGVAVAMAVISYRLVGLARALADRGSPRFVAATFAILAIGPALVISYWLARSSEDSAAARAVVATLIDGAVFLVAGAFAASLSPRDDVRARMRAFGPLIATALFAAGFAWIETSQTLGGAIRSGGGLAAALIGGLKG